MKEKLAGGGALVSAFAYSLCWQVPLILASFGLGSFTMSMWFARYRWVFMALTFVFLGFAYYKTYSNKKKCGFWSRWMLHGTAIFSLGMVIYTLINLHS